MTRQIESETLPGSRKHVTLILVGAVLAIGIMVTGVVLTLRSTMAEPRPVVLSVYCASSATWVNTLAPFFDSAPPAETDRDRGRVTSARIKAAYERRCTSPD